MGLNDSHDCAELLQQARAAAAIANKNTAVRAFTPKVRLSVPTLLAVGMRGQQVRHSAREMVIDALAAAEGDDPSWPATD
ncbi:MAG: hypothetical protein WBR28_08655 [Mycobacterium sp.]